ncbi:TPA: hypothetical protein EYP66_21560 [Candidatus Poribacteria bacterium]|nr:hypothetical protein [Candidatus Poribacteria bacterium]
MAILTLCVHRHSSFDKKHQVNIHRLLHAFLLPQKGELVAVMDIDAERTRSAQERYEIPNYYTTLNDIVGDDNIDAVMALTSLYHHRLPVIAAA